MNLSPSINNSSMTEVYLTLLAAPACNTTKTQQNWTAAN